jgi:cysteine desulfuration protein SufE
VWLTTRVEGDGEPVLHFSGDSDAMIVRGLVAVMLALYSGRTAREILSSDAEEVFRSLGLDEHLTPQRANGLRAMVQRIKHEAERSLAHAG